MSFIKDAISKAVESTQLHVRELDVQASNSIREEVEKLYASTKSSQPLWERCIDDVSKYDPNGWKAIGGYPYKEMVTMFFDFENESTMYSLKNCEELVSIISECPGFVFYVTNENCSFLLCHNDHDYLIGSGDAKSWIVDL